MQTMAFSRRNPSPTPSISSVISDVSSDVSVEEAEVRTFVKKRLMKRLFLGHYQERRLVEFLSVYRDMVVLHKSETELQVDIGRVQSKLMSFYGAGKWLGITSPDIIGAPAAGHCLWTKLQDVAFGFYWFQIRQIHFEEREIIVRLKVIRPVIEEVVIPSVSCPSFSQSISDNVETLKTCIRTSILSLAESQSAQASDLPSRIDKEEKSTKPVISSSDSEDIKKRPVPDSTTNEPSVHAGEKSLRIEDVVILMRLMLQNWKEIMIFLCGSFIGALSRLGKCVEYVGNFSLKFIHEMTLLLRTVTPIILAVIELVGKLVGGLFLLIAMFFGKGNVPPRQFAPARRAAIGYNNYPPRDSNRRYL